MATPKELVKKIDRAAKDQYGIRSEYIRQAVVSRLRTQDTEAWDALAAGADELSAIVEQAGLVSDEDCVRAGKEVSRAKRR